MKHVLDSISVSSQRLDNVVLNTMKQKQKYILYLADFVLVTSKQFVHPIIIQYIDFAASNRFNRFPFFQPNRELMEEIYTIR